MEDFCEELDINENEDVLNKFVTIIFVTLHCESLNNERYSKRNFHQYQLSLRRNTKYCLLYIILCKKVYFKRINTLNSQEG